MTQSNNESVPVPDTSAPTHSYMIKPLELTPPKKVEPESTSVEPSPNAEWEAVLVPSSKFLKLTWWKKA